MAYILACRSFSITGTPDWPAQMAGGQEWDAEVVQERRGNKVLVVGHGAEPESTVALREPGLENNGGWTARPLVPVHQHRHPKIALSNAGVEDGGWPGGRG